MKNKKYIALLLAASMTIAVAACGTSQTTTSANSSAANDTSVSVEATSAETKPDSQAEDTSSEEKTITARVDSVEGNTINVTIGELAGPEKHDGKDRPDGFGKSGSKDSSANTEDSQTPPELPDGEAQGGMGAPTDSGNGQTPPQKPDGKDFASMFTASEETATYTIEDSMLDGLTLADLTEGKILSITLNADGSVISISEPRMKGPNGKGGPGQADGSNGKGGPGGQDASSIEYKSATSYTEDTKTAGETYTSTGTDENAVLVDNGATVSVDQASVTRNSSDSTGGDSSSFYGVGAAMLAKDGTLNVSNSNIQTDAAGAAGVFAYGDGTAYVKDTTISTKQGTSGGIHVAGGGTLYAWDLDVTTDGASSAAIRSDRGGGTMVVDGGTYTSNGSGSPAVYTTADITVHDADLTATNSEAVCIEGLNTLRLFDCNLTGNMPDDSQNDNTWTVIVYQSMSGDSEVGTGNFSMVGGTLTSKNGGLFYTTNTESELYLSDVDINYSDDDDFLLQATGNANERGWGTTGENGAQCTFTADKQAVKGGVIYDSISTLDFYLTNESSLTGYFEDVETWAGNGGDGHCNVYVGKDSTWTVTKDSTIDALYAAGTIKDTDGKSVTIKGEDGTVYVQGDSDYTVTVTSYSEEDKSADALEAPSYTDYEVEKTQA